MQSGGSDTDHAQPGTDDESAQDGRSCCATTGQSLAPAGFQPAVFNPQPQPPQQQQQQQQQHHHRSVAAKVKDWQRQSALQMASAPVKTYYTDWPRGLDPESIATVFRVIEQYRLSDVALNPTMVYGREREAGPRTPCLFILFKLGTGRKLCLLIHAEASLSMSVLWAFHLKCGAGRKPGASLYTRKRLSSHPPTFP